MGLVQIEMPEEEFSFITKFDPDRDRTASRTQLVEVVRHIQNVVLEGLMPE